MINVETEDYRWLASQFQVAAGQISGALDALVAGLSGTGGMAGSDESAGNFTVVYDPGAARMVGAMAQLANACGAVSTLIAASGTNYQAAAAYSCPGQPVDVPTPVATMMATRVMAPELPMSTGAGPGPRAGDVEKAWNLAKYAIGYAWPDGDEGKLDAASQYWSNARSALHDVYDSLKSQVAMFTAANFAPELVELTVQVDQVMQGIISTAAGCAQLSSITTSYGAEVSIAHTELEITLLHMADQIAIAVGASAIGALFTMGISAILGSADVAAIIGETGVTIEGFIVDMVARVGAIVKDVEQFLATSLNWVARALPLLDRAVPIVLDDSVSALTVGTKFLVGEVSSVGGQALGDRLTGQPITAVDLTLGGVLAIGDSVISGLMPIKMSPVRSILDQMGLGTIEGGVNSGFTQGLDNVIQHDPLTKNLTVQILEGGATGGVQGGIGVGMDAIDHASTVNVNAGSATMGGGDGLTATHVQGLADPATVSTHPVDTATIGSTNSAHISAVGIDPTTTATPTVAGTVPAAATSTDQGTAPDAPLGPPAS